MRRESGGDSGRDLTVAVAGAITSFLTAAALSWAERHWEVAFYGFTLWFIVPAGAIGAGILAAGGYWAGARLLHVKPSRKLLVYVVAISVLSFFLLHWLNYALTEEDGEPISEMVSFAWYLDFVIEHTSMSFGRSSHALSTGEMGVFGYVVAVLQVAGFAFGGWFVHSMLAGAPFCDDCGRYMKGRWSLARHAARGEPFRDFAAKMKALVADGRGGEAAQAFAATGLEKWTKHQVHKAELTVKQCEGCSMSWMQLTRQEYDGKNWKDMEAATVTLLCPGDVAKPA